MSAQHELDLLDAAYRARVTVAVEAARKKGADTLTSICRQCHGAFPPLVRAVAARVLGAQKVPYRGWQDDEPGLYDGALPSMPEPHPIDYEWRYTAATADALSEHLASTASRVACFGTPTVFWRLRRMDVDAWLMDRNPGLLQSLEREDLGRVEVTDLLEDTGAGIAPAPQEARGFDAVLLDPPWYVDHTIAWIGRALKVLKPGGKLILTQFPNLVRPSAMEETAQITSYLQKLGGVERLPFDAVYTTPLFERETLSAFGLHSLGVWRSGCLLSITVSEAQLPDEPVRPTVQEWHRVQLGSQVIAVRAPDLGTVPKLPLRLRPPQADGSFLLKSVSARDPVRRNVAVWTSRNRALVATQGAHQILPFLRSLAGGSAPNDALKEAAQDSRDNLRLLLGIIGW